MPSFNLSNFDSAMKHMYPYKKVENLIYKNNPLLAMMPKETKFPGRNATYAIQYGQTGGRSSNFVTAQTNRSGVPIQHFVVDRVRDYAVVSVDNETLLAADGSEGSLLDVAKVKTDAALQALARAMGMDVYRDGSGTIGTVTAVASGTFTVSLGEVVNFEVGQHLQAVSPDGSGDDELHSNAIEVTAVNRDTGVVSYSGSVGQVNGSGIVVGTKIVGAGDWNVKLSGLDAWLPATTPAANAAAFKNVFRQKDPTRLAGQRIAYDTSIKNTLFEAGVRLNREGGRPDAVFINPVKWGELANSLEDGATTKIAAQRRYDSSDKGTTFGFASLEMASPAGLLKIYSDHNCPMNTAYMLQMDTWTLKTLGQAPRIIDFDGMKGLREANSDGVEYRWGYYGNVLCKAPGFNARVALA